MGFSPNLEDRERAKFVESPTRPGETAIEVVSGGESATYDLIYSTSGTYTYVGSAIRGSITSEPVWKIFRFDSVAGRLSYASDTYNQIWDNRGSLTYV